MSETDLLFQGEGGGKGRRGQEARAGRDLRAQVADLLGPQAVGPRLGVPAPPAGAGGPVPPRHRARPCACQARRRGRRARQGPQPHHPGRLAVA